jgi:hypothetical protein
MLLGKDKWHVEHQLPAPIPSPIPHIPETFQEYVDAGSLLSIGNVVRVLYYPGSHRPISGGAFLW